MLNWNYNEDTERQSFDLIPANAIVPVMMRIRPGQAGDGGWFTSSKNSDAIYLDCEFTVTGGPFYKRKFWNNFVFDGGKVDEHGRSIAGKITRNTMRAILESARGIDPGDEKPAACQARMVSGIQDFDGIEFIAKVGIEKGTGTYSDKNKLALVITPDKPEYAKAKSGDFGSVQTQPSAPMTAPSWGSQPAGPAPSAQPTAPPSGWQQTAPPAATQQPAQNAHAGGGHWSANGQQPQPAAQPAAAPSDQPGTVPSWAK